MEEKALLELYIRHLVDETVNEIVPDKERIHRIVFKRYLFPPSKLIDLAEGDVYLFNTSITNSFQDYEIINEKFPSFWSHDLLEYWGTTIAATLQHKLLNLGGSKKILSDVKQKMIDLKSINPIIGNTESVNRSIEQLQRRIDPIKPSQTTKNKYQLSWNYNLIDLDILSNRLYVLGYTGKADDFSRTIESRKKLKWKKEPAFLVYLLYKLFHHNPSIIKCTPKPFYWEASFEYFGERDSALASSRHFSDAMNRINSRTSGKYASIIKQADSLIAELIKKTT